MSKRSERAARKELRRKLAKVSMRDLRDLCGMPRPVELSDAEVEEHLGKLNRCVEAGGTVAGYAEAQCLDKESIYSWINSTEERSSAFARARDRGAEALVDDALRISDDAASDPDAQSRRLRGDIRLRIAACVRPQRFGQKAQVEHSGRMGIEQLVLGSKPEEQK